MPRGQSDVEGEAAHEVLRLGEVVEEADDLESALVQEALAVVAELPHFQLLSFFSISDESFNSYSDPKKLCPDSAVWFRGFVQ